VLHGILIDGVIERIEGSPEFAEAEVLRSRNAGHTSGYLFGARNNEEFERKKLASPLFPHERASHR